MKMTTALKMWLIDEKGMSADSSNDELCKAAADAIVDGSLGNTKLVELLKEPEADEANAFEARMDKLLGAVEATNKRLDAIEKPAEVKDAKAQDVSQGKDYSDAAVKDSAPRLDKATSGDGDSLLDAVMDKASQGTPERSGTQVDVISAHKQYDANRQKAVYPAETSKGQPHPQAGRQVYEDGGKFGKRPVSISSDQDKAVIGAWVKLGMLRDLGNRCPAKMRPNEHDMQLLNYAVREMEWAGVIGGIGTEDEGAIGIKGTKLPQSMWKAVLDDGGASGGLEIVPIVFDDDVIILPLLTGEVFPMVNVVPITRGRRVEGATIGNVTLASDEGKDGTAITLFVTTAFVAAFDTTIFSVGGAIELGLDFLSDSPIDLASIVTQQYGERLMEWLDEQICVGDGTTEPDGVLAGTGVTDITGGTLAIDDLESLLFSVAKQYRPLAQRDRIAFVTNETIYQAARALAVGAGDARRLFGFTYEDYSLLGHPYKINEGGAMGADNTKAIFGNFAHYRMYRRLGMTMNWTDEGKELRLANLLLGTARARFGGQIENGAYFSQASAFTGIT